MKHGRIRKEFPYATHSIEVPIRIAGYEYGQALVMTLEL